MNWVRQIDQNGMWIYQLNCGSVSNFEPNPSRGSLSVNVSIRAYVNAPQAKVNPSVLHHKSHHPTRTFPQGPPFPTGNSTWGFSLSSDSLFPISFLPSIIPPYRILQRSSSFLIKNSSHGPPHRTIPEQEQTRNGRAT
ncbi:hypothetical protein AVEN_25633-1 [Araneus ventricosus]|uniref:Uncharacterized protein n=1 Tax=Araneus ventricosus TaxID=182803 RepID=A0A4Y2BNJ4_ARAVE|nr:hypothetical protein AVEN_25633-1 [Araneus ventricosus]